MQSSPRELQFAPGDWSLVDGRDVVTMHYDPDGQFRGAQLLDAEHIQRHRIAADALWHHTEPFTAWWGRHPEHHRSAGRAA
ncbi:MAG: DUF6879 family protein [Pseudonocardiaceae bacterium]